MADALPSHPAPNRELLFGILALEMKLVSHPALMSALAQWTQRPATPLGQILEEQGSLRSSDHAALARMVSQQLSQRSSNGDLRSVSLEASTTRLEDLSLTGDPTQQAVPFGMTGPWGKSLELPEDEAPPTGCRYRTMRLHARGGLGDVFMAEDLELGREVALKEIREPYADDPASRSRFLLEAEINARLQHPAIVPVYSLGRHADGRPYYAMRFIQGETLQKAVARFHAADKPGRDVGERSLALRQLLGQFVAVCNAVAYAHSRGILHRDIKPGNILLGKFGETLLVDWGLAKVTGRPDPSGDTVVVAARRSDSDPGTVTGTTLGTPIYMSPEQAAGGADVGTATDVYGLGATLYAILTGRAPIEGKARSNVLEKVRTGAWLPPRQVKRNVPEPLDAICRKAIALRPDDRYRSPQAFAADVEHWLADEPVSAWPEPMRVRTGRWARRHKVLVGAATAALFATIVLGAGGWIWLKAERAERARGQERDRLRREHDAGVEFAQATTLNAEARGAGPERARRLTAQALAAAKRADGLLAGGPSDPELRQRVNELIAQLVDQEHDRRMLGRLDEVRLSRAEERDYPYDEAAAAGEYDRAFRELGLNLREQSDAEVAQWLQLRSVRMELAAVLDDWAGVARDRAAKVRLLSLARALDADEERNRLRDALGRDDLPALKAFIVPERLATLPAPTAVLLAKALTRREAPAEAVTVLRQAQRRHAADFWVNYELGYALYKLKQPQLEEAVRYLTVAVSLRPQSAGAHHDLGVVLRMRKATDEAIVECRKALELRDFAQGHVSLGNALFDKDRKDEAMAEYRKATELDPKNAAAHLDLAMVLRDKKKPDEAIPEYRKAIALKPDLAAQAQNGLGLALYDKAEFAEAIKAYREAIRLNEKEFAFHTNLGVALRANGQVEDAVAEYQISLRLNPNYAQTYQNLGYALFTLGRLDEAEAALRKALDLGHEPAAVLLKRCQRLLALERRLPAVLAGTERPTPQELLEFADLCHRTKQQYATAARLCAEAFAAEPRLAEAVNSGRRYNAACSAVLAAAGKGADAVGLEQEDRVRLRCQALDWLQADLDAWTKALEGKNAAQRASIQRTLRRWQQDADLATVREPSTVTQLPEGEREAWRKLWADLEGLLIRNAAP